jgi:hypothetical protein
MARLMAASVRCGVARIGLAMKRGGGIWWSSMRTAFGVRMRGARGGCSGGKSRCSAFYRIGGLVRSNDRRWSGSSMRWFLARELTGRC